ncbi:glucokinase [Sphingomonas xanthus]|uniref:Glucokinase n=1 Tax=Sphingomonas xanthus TaxID=2594473 RepID=A0A516ISI8_9SPHN|nr:glucokinase [Sphingomonas xanthus]QDP19871.1 glucokinase [Sphingomonas xanthus]
MAHRIAVADIGGTHARFALADIAEGAVVGLGDPLTLATSDHASFQTAWQQFGHQLGEPLPTDLGVAFAGTVQGDVLKLTNNPWVIQPALMKEKLGVERFLIVNDFGAVAHAVAQLGPDHFDHLCGPDRPLPATGVTSVVGPGTGLGVAQLLRHASGYHVIETEGGHVDFAPLDGLEDRILQYLRRQFRRVSTERIACGSGLANLYDALASIEGQNARYADDKALWAAALEGRDPLAGAALDRFFLTLGAVAGDLALSHGANAVVIAGGLGFRLKDRFAGSGFADRFIAKGRFERRMEAIPVKLVTHPQPGLYGAAAAFAIGLTGGGH